MQRDLENESGVVTRGNHPPGCRGRKCFYSVGQKTASTCCVCPVLSILHKFFCLWESCGMHTMDRFKLVFVLNKFIVLFICVVSSVWFTFRCRFVFLSSVVENRGDWFRQEEGWMIHTGIGMHSTLVVFYFNFSFLLFLFYSFFPLLSVFIQTESS
jgi:hypothetical protein